ncbi:HTH-type transcriptional activator RhaS [Pseudovibrio axinellae]|uniref:HTH-type transcriptional activator RhaS n=1 Tax=Pseudovibrio axinellae TaxID=989403 RepID=A0A166AMC9_9HYPH|nr:AraC family transcriptional regulator [Pseudovibrio axinellae]KZL21307.1 HTH-type transcriptional activator RhaS [Pseudovibrio axinellae]SEQ95559.1 AraC-type DNA-binding protein [Pseudovibrio axinellae]
MTATLVSVPAQNPHSDRLSSLIERFKVKAYILKNTEDDVLQGNFFILRCGKGLKKLVFLPSDGNNQEEKRRICNDRTVLAGARIEFGGPGSQLSAAFPTYVEVALHETPDLQRLSELLVEEVLSPQCGSSAVINRLCEVVFIRLLRHTIRSGVARSGLFAGLAHPNLAQALVAIHEEPAKNWSLESLAEVSGMSRTQFSVHFKEVIGETPGSYLGNWRLALAKQDLEAGRSLKSIAARVGFTSPTALSRAYQRRYQELPRNVALKTDVRA